MIDNMIRFSKAQHQYWEDRANELPELDLHGIPIHDAWETFKRFVDTTSRTHHRKARIITGQGKMCEEFADWAANQPKLKSCILERSGGSFIIKFVL